MLFFLPPFMSGIVAFALYVVFTVILAVFLLTAAAVKFAVPFQPVKKRSSRVADWIASDLWVACSMWTHRLTGRIRWEVSGAEDIRTQSWCLIISNHQSWVDILVLTRVFAGKVPPYKFFIKKELLWLPFFGQCLWALDFPVMKRYSKAFLEKYPHLKGKDLETARSSCEKFKNMPVSVINFIEGTRFAPEKHKRQSSTFRHLLIPRAGGLAMAIYAMGELFEYLVDVTIVYPEGVPGLWDFFCGKTRRVKVNVRIVDIPEDVKRGNYFQDLETRRSFNQWLNQLWTEKDRTLDEMLSETGKKSSVQ